MLKEIKDDINKWKDIGFSLIGRMKYEDKILFKVIYRFNTIPNKNLNGTFCKNSKGHPKIQMEPLE